MKMRAIRAAIGLTILLAIVSFIISCGDQTPSNSNTPAPANINPSISAANPCRPGLDIRDRIEELRTAVNTEIAGDAMLQYQRSQGMFDVTFDRYPNVADGQTIVMRIKGKLRGIQPPPDPANPSQGDRDGSLKTLLRFIDKYIKKGCVHKVIFEPMSSERTTSEAAFEWGACEDPKILCDNGFCQMSCDGMIPKDTPTPPTNVNTNAPVSPNRGNSNVDTTNANRGTSNAEANRGP